MDSKAFLAKQLDQTAQIIEWAVTFFSDERLSEVPPHSTHPNAPEWGKTFFGEWSALRVLFHLLYYEETIALPSIKHWIGEPVPDYPKSSEEEEAWKKCNDKSELLDRFHKIRKSQLEIINRIDPMDWEKNKLVYHGHGKVSAYWFVAKTIQHTLAHGDKLLRKALYWDDALQWFDSHQ